MFISVFAVHINLVNGSIDCCFFVQPQCTSCSHIPLTLRVLFQEKEGQMVDLCGGLTVTSLSMNPNFN